MDEGRLEPVRQEEGEWEEGRVDVGGVKEEGVEESGAAFMFQDMDKLGVCGQEAGR